MLTILHVESWSGKTLTVRVHRLWIALAIAAIAFVLASSVVSADLSGTRRMDRDNRRCASIGRQVERHGITEREYARLARHHCKRSGETWVSDRFYQA